MLRDDKSTESQGETMREAFKAAGHAEETAPEAFERIWKSTKRHPLETMRRFKSWMMESPSRMVEVIGEAFVDRAVRAFCERASAAFGRALDKMERPRKTGAGPSGASGKSALATKSEVAAAPLHKGSRRAGPGREVARLFDYTLSFGLTLGSATKRDVEIARKQGGAVTRIADAMLGEIEWPDQDVTPARDLISAKRLKNLLDSAQPGWETLL